MLLEILIPIRNPTEVFRLTVDSLAAQTDRGFSVLLSDNFSTSGQEHLEYANRLAERGIAVRCIRPPVELGRVEHWNWLHYQSKATWLKPLFAGDWLEADYVATVRGTATAEPRCAYIYTGYSLHRAGELQSQSLSGAGRFQMPEEMQEAVLRYAMQFGPPSAAAYRWDAFLRSGGYEPTLPIAADSLLFCKLAARHGVFGVPRACVHFNIHGARFSDTLPGKRRETFRETMRYYADLGLTAWQERWRFPWFGYARLFARAFRDRLKER